jgi:hypothetical protein
MRLESSWALRSHCRWKAVSPSAVSRSQGDAETVTTRGSASFAGSLPSATCCPSTWTASSTVAGESASNARRHGLPTGRRIARSPPTACPPTSPPTRTTGDRAPAAPETVPCTAFPIVDEVAATAATALLPQFAPTGPPGGDDDSGGDSRCPCQNKHVASRSPTASDRRLEPPERPKPLESS